MEGDNNSSTWPSLATKAWNIIFGKPDLQSETTPSKHQESSSFENEESPEEAEASQVQVCKFFLEGRCRFGDECLNTHPEGVQTPPNTRKASKGKKKEDEAISKKKKRPMKTAMDVIHRIQWDNSLTPDFFFVGYIDRFKGIVEEPFVKFSNWGDIVSAEYEALAIPQHRIVYFKYKDTKVWDKEEKLDLVFGSTGNNEASIVDLMNQVDERIKEELRSKEESDSEYDDDDYSTDEECHIELDKSKINSISMIPEEERSTHFLAIRVTSQDVIDKAAEIQRHIVRQEEALGECCMKHGLFHITIGMLRLPTHKGIQEAIHLVELMKPYLTELNVNLRLQGLETFGQRVLYAKVQPEPEDQFWIFISRIKNSIAQSSSDVIVTNKFEFTPHMTLIKVNRPIARLRKSKYLPSALYEDFVDDSFGVQKIDNLQLCVIEATTRYDGFYRTLCEITVDDNA